MPVLLVIDNYDSFTFNLVQMFLQYNLLIKVYRSDKISLKDVEKISPDYILISPGPKDPTHSGISIPLIKRYYKTIPILGVCLGMQCISEAFLGKTIKAPVPKHGKTSLVTHNEKGIFNNIPSPFKVVRYHSLVVKHDNKKLNNTGFCDDIIMALAHKDAPLFGVQFHPESFLTEHGFTLIENFLKYGCLKNFSDKKKGVLEINH